MTSINVEVFPKAQVSVGEIVSETPQSKSNAIAVLMAEVVCCVASFFFGALESSNVSWGFDADRWSKQFDNFWID